MKKQFGNRRTGETSNVSGLGISTAQTGCSCDEGQAVLQARKRPCHIVGSAPKNMDHSICDHLVVLQSNYCIISDPTHHTLDNYLSSITEPIRDETLSFLTNMLKDLWKALTSLTQVLTLLEALIHNNSDSNRRSGILTS